MPPLNFQQVVKRTLSDLIKKVDIGMTEEEINRIQVVYSLDGEKPICYDIGVSSEVYEKIPPDVLQEIDDTFFDRIP